MQITRSGLASWVLISALGCGTGVDPAQASGASSGQGGSSGSGSSSGSSSATGGGGTTGAGGAGWQLRDQTPYPRSSAAAIVDPDGDRLIVFGGGANDTWAQPLSGPHQGEWTQIALAGPHPPGHAVPYTMFRAAAVHDPIGKRMIFLESSWPSSAKTNANAVVLWQLSLEGEPTWSELVTAGPSPGNEIQNGQMVVDPVKNRLIMISGSSDASDAVSGVWALSLDTNPTWKRLADTPPQKSGALYVDHSVLLDPAGDQLLVFGGHPQQWRLWGLSLSTLKWTLLDEDGYGSDGYWTSAVLDAKSRRIIISGDDPGLSVGAYSLVTKTWSHKQALVPWAAAGALDEKRGRMLLFGGEDKTGIHIDGTLALPFDTLVPSTLIPVKRYSDRSRGTREVVFDSTRGAVVAFGGIYTPLTEIHGLAPAGNWTPLDVGATPSYDYPSGIYDPAGQAIVAFSGHTTPPGNGTFRLFSAPGAVWETIPAQGPSARYDHLTVYDDLRHRMVVFGGRSVQGMTTLKTDVWALSLDGTPEWKELTPKAGGPDKQSYGWAGAYDPVGDRLVVLGRRNYSDGAWAQEAFTLSLGDTPTWASLSLEKGILAAPSGKWSAVYDPAGKRMIAVDQGSRSVAVYALELGDVPRLHRFCPGPESLSPTTAPSPTGTGGDLVLTPEGLFLPASEGAFRFDLSTAYCD